MTAPLPQEQELDCSEGCDERPHKHLWEIETHPHSGEFDVLVLDDDDSARVAIMEAAERAWDECEEGEERVIKIRRNKVMQPDVVTSWDALPDSDGTVDVLVYDPPHLPIAAASPKSLQKFASDFGLARSVKADNIASMHAAFLSEARRVLRLDGVLFAKIKDYIHNHKYQWNLEMFNQAVRAADLTPCDLIIKHDPTAGNLKSGRWEKAHHARNVHCYWAVIRKGRCEPRNSK